MVRTRQIYNEITTHQIIWSGAHDRYVFIRYDKNGEIDGLNFVHGSEEHNCSFNNYDAKLLELYRQVIFQMKLKDKRFDLETINRVMWLYTAMINSVTRYMDTKEFMDLMEI